MPKTELTHDEALRLIDEHIGERAYLGLILATPGGGDESGPGFKFLETVGRLLNPLAPRPPRLAPDTGYYAFGLPTGGYPIAPIAEWIELRDSGLDFHLVGGSLIRVSWAGSSEVGNGPDVGTLARLRLLGLASEDEARTDDPSIELRRFLRTVKRASARILSAEPTGDRPPPGRGGERRIWRLDLRVVPTDGETFEAVASVAWPLSGEVEERLSRGESLRCAPVAEESIAVAFDPRATDEVMAYPDQRDAAEPPRLRLGIVARVKPDD